MNRSQNSDAPLVSIVVPVYRTNLLHLEQMVSSAVEQSAHRWELVLVNDGSGVAELSAELQRQAERDPRVKVVECETNGGIGRATQIGIEHSTGEFVGLLDHDDMLERTTVAEIQKAVAQHPDVDVIYTDEYWVDEHGQAPRWFRKPEWSPERLRGQMYLGHICVYRRSLLDEIGGMRTGYDGSQDYDLALRATEKARLVHHIPLPLYRWRIHETSVSHSAGNEPVFQAAVRALTEHLERIGLDADIEQIHPIGVYRTHRRVTGRPKISVIIPTRGSRGVVRGQERCMVVEIVRDIVHRSSYDNVEIVVVWDTGMDQAILDELSEIAGNRLVLAEYGDDFNFSRKINRGAVHSTGDFLLMLNDDVEVIDQDWLEVLVSLCQMPGVGMAGSLLLFENGTIQHAGHIYQGSNAGHAGMFLDGGNAGFGGELLVEREMSGVTAACAMVPREVFWEVGGFSTTLPVNFNDVDFSLKIRQAGYRTVVSPFARLYHYESTTREVGISFYEEDELHARWQRHMQVEKYHF